MTSTTLSGIFRSLRIYRGDRVREAAMDRLYARYLREGDLAFDIGAHVGDRIAAFRRLGARVVAVEPQPLCHRALRLLHGRDTRVHLVRAAVSDGTAGVVLHVNRANPTVSTTSPHFITAAANATGWEGQLWEDRLEVPALTLDALIAAHGLPQFVKIDVEGHEPAVLRGLGQRLPALSFEFTTMQRRLAFDCLERLAHLGDYRFDAALGESQQFVFGGPVDASRLANWIESLPDEANSGDVYATLARDGVDC
jgi:FkbM family methyltransferase